MGTVAKLYNRLVVALASPRTARLAGVVLCAVLAMALTAEPALAQGEVLDAAKDIVKKVISLLISIAALLLALGFATNFVQGMFETMIGRPMGLSNTWMKVAAIVICAGGAFLSVTAANMIIDALAGYTGGEIRMPGEAPVAPTVAPTVVPTPTS